MSHSLNETGGLCKRAARGAGLDWGLADEAARVARWAARFELPGARLLVRHLERLAADPLAGPAPVSLQSPWRAASGRLCPVIAGATLSDVADRFAAEPRLDLQHVAFPLLFCAAATDVAARLHACVQVEWNGLQLSSDGRHLGVAGRADCVEDEACVQLSCTIVSGPLSGRIATAGVRAELDPVTLARLTALAERSYAPATEQSRRRGAGGADDG